MPSIISLSTSKTPFSVMDLLLKADEASSESFITDSARVKPVSPTKTDADFGTLQNMPQPKKLEAVSQTSTFKAVSLAGALKQTVGVIADKLHMPVNPRIMTRIPVQSEASTPAPAPKPAAPAKKLSAFELRNEKVEAFMETKAYAALSNSKKLLAQGSQLFWRTLRNRFHGAVDMFGDHRQKGAVHAI